MLSITIAALGDSLSDEYQFYAPYRSAAANWPMILSALRPNQVDFGAFSATGAGRGQTRNQGYAQDWALQGMTAQGTDLSGYDATFANEYNGGYSAGLPGLLTQPGGISNVDVVNILIGGNDYFRAILQTIQTGVSFANRDKITQIFEEANAGFIGAIQQVVPLIQAANPNTHIIIDTTPSVADIPIIQTVAANLGNVDGAILKGFINSEVDNLDYNGSPPGSTPVYESIQKFAQDNKLGYVDANALVKSFVANPTFGGIYINPNAAGPVFTDMFVGDEIHPGTIAQARLANAIIDQIDTWYPNAITSLSTAEVLQYAQSVQPKATAILTASARGVAPGQQVTFKLGVPTFPPNYETSPAPPAMPGPIAYPVATGVVSFIDAANRSQVLGTRQLDATGTATFPTSRLSSGLHQIIAIYSGNAVYPPSVSSTISIMVGATASQVRVLKFFDALSQEAQKSISTKQLRTWLGWVRHGAKPRAVERVMARAIQLQTHPASGKTIAARAHSVGQSATTKR
jgi:hypothetical protein